MQLELLGRLEVADRWYLPQVVPCLALHDTMRHIGSSVATVGFGGCMGMSGFMLAVGAKVQLPLPFHSMQVSTASHNRCNVKTAGVQVQALSAVSGHSASSWLQIYEGLVSI